MIWRIGLHLLGFISAGIALLQFPSVQKSIVEKITNECIQKYIPDCAWLNHKTLQFEVGWGFFPLQIVFNTITLTSPTEQYQVHGSVLTFDIWQYLKAQKISIYGTCKNLDYKNSTFSVQGNALKFSGTNLNTWDLRGDMCVNGPNLKSKGPVRITPGMLHIKSNTVYQDLICDLEAKIYGDLLALTCKKIDFICAQGTLKNQKFFIKTPLTIPLNQIIPSISFNLDAHTLTLENLKIPLTLVNGTVHSTGKWQGDFSLTPLFIPFLSDYFKMPTAIMTHIVKGPPTVQGSLTGTDVWPSCTLKIFGTIHPAAIPGFPKIPDINAEMSGTFHGDGTTDHDYTCKFGAPLMGYFNSHGTFNIRPSGIYVKKMTIDHKLILNCVTSIFDLNDPIRGTLLFSLTGQGPIETLRFNGTCELTEGYYENLDTGTLFEHIKGHAVITHNRLKWTELIGQDRPAKKKKKPQFLIGSGEIDWTHWTAPTVDLTLNFKELEVARSDWFWGRASGELTLYGPLFDPKVKGAATLNKARLLLEEVGDPDISKIKILNKSVLSKVGLSKKKKKKKNPNIVPLSIIMTIPKKLYIRGFGLDSEWMGEMKIKDSITDPHLEGQIKSLRGNFNLLGRRLRLHKGRITYEAGDPEYPIVDLTMVKPSLETGVEVFLLIKGKAPGVTTHVRTYPMRSPSDSLSLLLFGKESSNISIFQAAQLASALGAMGGNKGLDILSQFQSIFKVDYIEIQEHTIMQKDGQSKKSQVLSISRDFGGVTVALQKGAESNTGGIHVTVPFAKKGLVAILEMMETNPGTEIRYQRRY